MDRRKPTQKQQPPRNLSLVPPVAPQLFYFDCGHAAFQQSEKESTAVLKMAPKLKIEAINEALAPELRGKVQIMCYPAHLCGICEPDSNRRIENTLTMVKAQLKADRLPIPPDSELRAQIKRSQEQKK